MEYISFFDTIKISILWYGIIVAASLIAIIGFSGYFWFEYHNGKSLKEFFWGRIKGWTNPKIALFQIFDPINNTRFKYARKEQGDTYRFGEEKYVTPSIKPASFLSKIFGNKKKVSLIDKSLNNEIITPKSIYTINGVKTIPIFEPYPELNPAISKGLSALIEKGIFTLEEFELIVYDNEVRNTILFDEYTYEKFYEIYISSKNKYELNITLKDTVNFMSSTFDKNFRESIEAKDFNVKQNKKENGAQKYKTALIVGGFVVTAIIILYKVIWG